MPAVFFDLFGTLITAESDDKAHRALSEKLSEIHGGVFSGDEHFRIYHELVHSVGGEKLTSSQAVWRALEILSSRYGFKLKVTQSQVRLMHLKFHVEYAEPYPDSHTSLMLAKSACGKVGLITDADDEMAWGIIRRLGFDSYLDVVVTSEAYGVSKPNPKLFLIAAERLGVSPVECAMIGDSWKDVEGAKKAGMKAVLVKHRDIELTVEPDEIATSLYEAVEKTIRILGCRKSSI